MTILRKTSPVNADTKIPAVGFGTYLIASGDAADAVRTAISIGYRHVDTAAIYENEEAVGEGIRAGSKDSELSRQDIFVTTKLRSGNAGWNEAPKTCSPSGPTGQFELIA